jgi:hypothetical protein
MLLLFENMEQSTFWKPWSVAPSLFKPGILRHVCETRLLSVSVNEGIGLHEPASSHVKIIIMGIRR